MVDGARKHAPTSVVLTRRTATPFHYDEVQFTKTEQILSGMGLELEKTDRALAELREKGLA